MNSFLVFDEEKTGDSYTISDQERINHVLKVLKSQVGDTLIVCLVGSGIGKGILEEISSEHLKIKLQDISPRAQAPFELLIGVSRPHSCQKILEHGTSLGVSSFNFFTATLSEKSYLDSKLFLDPQKYLRYGLSQSGLYHKLPEVSLSKKFTGKQKFILHPGTNKTFADYPLNPNDNITLAIGPERGFTKEEVEHFKSLGFLEVSLGRPILRVEIATFAALGQLHLLLGT
jgi:16S rRNA (uracil1498-N3)-methyltransferase